MAQSQINHGSVTDQSRISQGSITDQSETATQTWMCHVAGNQTNVYSKCVEVDLRCETNIVN